MSLISILAKTPTVIDWKEIAKVFLAMNLKEVEVFPIPIELGFSENAIGITVHRNFSSLGNVNSEIEKILTFLSKRRFVLFELYDGEKIDLNNFERIISPILTTT